MTTIEEQLSLMDWLRDHGGIGDGCVYFDEQDAGHHMPEHCQTEMEEYLRVFETGLRQVGPVGERAYSTIRQAAKDAWRVTYAEDYDGPVMRGRVQAYLDSLDVT